MATKVKWQVQPLEGFPTRSFEAGDVIVNEPVPVTKTADATLDGSERIVIADATANTVTLTLASDTPEGTRLVIKAIGNGVNAIDVATEGSEEIDGAATYDFAGVNDAVELVYDGSDWFVIATA